MNRNQKIELIRHLFSAVIKAGASYPMARFASSFAYARMGEEKRQELLNGISNGKRINAYNGRFEWSK